MLPAVSSALLRGAGGGGDLVGLACKQSHMEFWVQIVLYRTRRFNSTAGQKLVD